MELREAINTIAYNPCPPGRDPIDHLREVLGAIGVNETLAPEEEVLVSIARSHVNGFTPELQLNGNPEHNEALIAAAERAQEKYPKWQRHCEEMTSRARREIDRRVREQNPEE